MNLPEGKMGDASLPLLCQPLLRPGVGAPLMSASQNSHVLESRWYFARRERKTDLEVP